MTIDEAIKWLKVEASYIEEDVGHGTEILEAYDMAIEALEQQLILDKIRAEIEEKYGNYDICEWFNDYDYEENDISEYRPIGNIADVLEIIDKYRKEEVKANEVLCL